MMHNEQDALRFPWPEAPEPGVPVEVAPGILWVRFPLPFRLDHVNIYLIADGDGWAVVDTGISDDVTREAWGALLNGPLAGQPLTRLIVTHFHPDHIGLAGWLCAEFGIPLLTSQTSFLMCNVISLTPGAAEAKPYRDFYLRHGMDAETAQMVSTQGHQYLQMVAPLPPTFLRLLSGDTLTIGGRQFRVYSGDGHAPEQIMLYLPEEKILLAADQVIARITPNISVWAVDPDGDPLGHYLRTTRTLESHVPEDTLVLPGHELPFYGLAERCRQIVNHHEDRCRMITEACADGPKSVAELVPVVFQRPLDPHQLSFAFSETHAHVNRLIRRGELAWIERNGGVACVLAK
ncbi:MBL fold metallo-hydrolase [Amorphus coralli]|uniref:MBL fold metallo-hydrolase n=1 Tax=Amorphus coralli TaxID=340680 RepID=UPI00036C890D|nr:MBL fold metallo-hydrolase [Amorphus coralli]